jgi:hypothetical protein
MGGIGNIEYTVACLTEAETRFKLNFTNRKMHHVGEPTGSGAHENAQDTGQLRINAGDDHG